MTEDLDAVIRASDVVVHPGRYSYLKATRKPAGSHFLIAEDADEVTVITDETAVDTVPYSENVSWFRLIEVKVATPFEAKGFLAALTKAIAEAGLNVLVVSTFSKNYLLVREGAIEAAVAALKAAGFPVAQAREEVPEEV